jgi:hypothetical protein
MQMKNLPVKRFSEGHEKAASSKLTVVDNDMLMFFSTPA